MYKRQVYEHCDSARSIAYLTRELGEASSPDSIEAALKWLVRNKLILATSKDRYLSLGVEPIRDLTFYATPAETGTGWVPYRPKPAPFRIREIPRRLRRYGKDTRDGWIRRLAFSFVRLLTSDRSRYPFTET